MYRYVEAEFNRSYEGDYCHHEHDKSKFVEAIDRRFTFGDEWDLHGVPAGLYKSNPVLPVASKCLVSTLLS